MKLKIFDSTTVVAVKRGKHSINIHPQKGLFTLNKLLVNTMQLKKGDCISIAQDESSPKDWFLFKSKTGFELKSDKRRTLLYSRATARAIAESISIDYTTTFLVGKESIKTDGIEYWPIITKSGIKSK